MRLVHQTFPVSTFHASIFQAGLSAVVEVEDLNAASSREAGLGVVVDGDDGNFTT
jgi:hypothetical protein